MRLITIPALILIAGCQSNAATKAPNTPIELTTKQISTLHAGIKTTLKDPTSPVFGKQYAVKEPDGSILICGYINSKNSFGGFTGNRPYIAYLFNTGKFDQSKIATDQNSTQATLKVCRQRGVGI